MMSDPYKAFNDKYEETGDHDEALGAYADAWYDDNGIDPEPGCVTTILVFLISASLLAGLAAKCLI